MRDLKGHVIDHKYELVELVSAVTEARLWRGTLHGAGGFAVPVAIRPIEARVIADPRVLRAAELRHPNVVQVSDVCRDETGYYLILEWVEGITLRDFLRAVQQMGLPLPWPVAVAIAVGALRGLGAAHDHVGADGKPAPILHCSISVESVRINRQGITKLDAFGLGERSPCEAPEVALRATTTARSDVFAMGALLWEMLIGAPPLNGDRELIVAFQAGELKPLRLDEHRFDLPSRLRAAVERALAFSADDRFGTADEMATELVPLLHHVPWQRNPQADLGRAVLEAIAALGTSTVHDVSDSEIVVVPDGDPNNPILLSRLAAQPLTDDDFLSVEERDIDDYASFEVVRLPPALPPRKT